MGHKPNHHPASMVPRKDTFTLNIKIVTTKD